MRASRRSAFTLVELLVVVSIIALLIAILLPSLSKARKQTKAVICQTNIRSLSTGAFTYVSEWTVYPPSLSNFGGSAEGGVDWLGIGDQYGAVTAGEPDDPQTGNPKGFSAAPKFGVLFPYVREPKAYLCAEDRPGKMEAATILGGGGNGKFSYTMFANMGLASPDKIPSRRREIAGGSRGGSTKGERLPKRALAAVPIFVEEHPKGINDTGQNGHIEGNFNFVTDIVVSRHPPFNKRKGVDPVTGVLGTFVQGRTNIGFADGHVAPINVNFGFTSEYVKESSTLYQGPGNVPYTAEGLLYHFGIEYIVKEVN